MTNQELYQYLADSNEGNYNLLKACEELSELQEVILKRILKSKSEKNPSNTSIIEEIGDCKIRLFILSKIFGEEEVNKRVIYKCNKYKEYLLQDKYKGAI